MKSTNLVFSLFNPQLWRSDCFVLRCTCIFALCGIYLYLVNTAYCRGISEEAILKGASERIEKYRKGKISIIVKDSIGHAVVDAKVSVEQTRHDFLFGCNIYMWGHFREPEREKIYRERFAALLNYATLGFYWWAYEPQRGKPRYGYTDRVAAWCKENGITCKGHPLVWNYVDPKWLPEDINEIKKLSDARVRDIVSRYKGRIDIWDVVNEAVAVDRLKNRMTKWALSMGRTAYTANALKIAREANPNAMLLVNDYRVDPKYKKLLETLKENGDYLFDTIGIQSHMHSGPWPISRVWDVCERYSSFGVPLHFTEVTVVSGPKRPMGWNTTPEGEKKQADYVEKFYTTLFSHPSVEAITWWDFADAGAWQHAPAGLLRKDLSPKPVYERLLHLIKGKWWTKVDAKTDNAGKLTLRGFYGDYLITVRRADGKEATQKVHLKKDGKNDFTIVLK